jgi:carboxypeptidase T
MPTKSALSGRVPSGPLPLLFLALGLAAGQACAHPGHGPRATPGAEGSSLRQMERQRVEIYKAWYPDRATARKAAVTLHQQLLETDHQGGWQIFELDGEQIALLQQHGYRIEPATEFLLRRDAFLAALDAAQARSDAARRARGLAPQEVGIQAIPGYACYETVEETYAAAQGFTATHPHLAQWLPVGSSWQKTANQGGYDIGVLKLTHQASPSLDGQPKPRLFIQSAMHAREYTTAPLALAFARWLLEGYGTQADATWLLDHHEVHLMLHVNPDGRKRAEAGLSWRKNTNTAYCGPTSNNRGADLNRNFSFGWNSTNGQGSSGSACNNTYRGPSPASEPETRAVEAYVRSLWPDRRGPLSTDPAPADTSGLHIDLHSFSELILWPWGNTAAPAPNGAALQTLGRRLAWFNGYTPTQSIGLYPTDGTSDGVSYGELGVAAITFELGTSFFQTCGVYESTILPENLPALVYAAKVARAPYLLPGGPEVTGVTVGDGQAVAAGVPVALSASASDARFNQGNGTEPVQAVAAAAAYIGLPPWAPGATAIALQAADGAFDSPTEALAGSLPTAGLAPGRHLVFVQATDAGGQPGPVSAGFIDVAAPAASLSVAAQAQRRGGWTIGLLWSTLAGSQVDIYRNGLRLNKPSPNSGKFTDQVLQPGSYSYRVCEAGSSLRCTPTQTIGL